MVINRLQVQGVILQVGPHSVKISRDFIPDFTTQNFTTPVDKCQHPGHEQRQWPALSEKSYQHHPPCCSSNERRTVGWLVWLDWLGWLGLVGLAWLGLAWLGWFGVYFYWAKIDILSELLGIPEYQLRVNCCWKSYVWSRHLSGFYPFLLAKSWKSKWSRKVWCWRAAMSPLQPDVP